MSKFIADHSLNIAHMNKAHTMRPVFGCDYCAPVEVPPITAASLCENIETTMRPLLYHGFEKTHDDVLMLLQEYFYAER
jgi:hypothetical protein